MASAVDSRLAYARLSAVATASRLPTANRGSNNSYTTSWDTTGAIGHLPQCRFEMLKRFVVSHCQISFANKLVSCSSRLPTPKPPTPRHSAGAISLSPSDRHPSASIRQSLMKVSPCCSRRKIMTHTGTGLGFDSSKALHMVFASAIAFSRLSKTRSPPQPTASSTSPPSLVRAWDIGTHHITSLILHYRVHLKKQLWQLVRAEPRHARSIPGDAEDRPFAGDVAVGAGRRMRHPKAAARVAEAFPSGGASLDGCRPVP